MRALAMVGFSVLAMTSCAVPSIVDCGDDRFCPAGSVCTPTGCSLPGVCGDGAIDDGELCDDGNRTSRDGCSSACIVEGCPNGELDLGEECDDGNALSHDGCSSGCLVERPTWQQLMPSSPPGPLSGMAAAWIPDRGRAILHGGANATSTRGEVWWWDGVTWTPAPSGPPPLQRHAMASDGGSGVVMFGGSLGSGPATAACWLWDAAWTPCVGPVPPARFDAAMAVGAAAGEVILYGGTDAFVELRATWRRTAGGWSDLDRQGPRAASMPAMAYNPRAREHVLIFLGTVPAQTWELGAAGWTGHADSSYARDSATLVFDADRGTMVAFGGNDEVIGIHNETAERDATGWVEVAVGLRPPPRVDHVSFHDPIRRGVVLFGGYGTTIRTDTWILRWESATADEDCAVTTDADRDGLEGCADPDCWGRCDPRCAPRVSDCDPARPRCGDGTCNLDLETTALCPADCP